MSDSQAYEQLTVTSDGVTVVKRFEEDEFPVPAIAFEFNSDRDEDVRVVLSDTVPEGIEVEDLGFHPEYGSEYWTIDEDKITFERELDANSSYTTVYGIRATGSDDVEQFLTRPTLEEVDPPLPEEEKPGESVIPESGDDVVKDAIAGDGEIPGLEGEDGDGNDEDVETLDLKDPNDPEAGALSGASGGTATAGDDSGGGRQATGGSVIAAMASEIRQQNVSAEDVKLLRRAFEIAGEDGGTTAAKIEQIQTDIADLRAYTSSLEEFLDDNGTAQQIIEGFDQQLDEFDDRLNAMQSELESNSGELSEFGSRIESFDEEIESMSDEVDSMTEQVDTIANEVDAVSETVDAVEGEVDTVKEDVDAVEEDVDAVSDEMESMSAEIDDLDGTITDVEEEINQLREETAGGDVQERIESIEQELKDLREWQDQIKQTFGG